MHDFDVGSHSQITGVILLSIQEWGVSLTVSPHPALAIVAPVRDDQIADAKQQNTVIGLALPYKP